MRTGIACAIWLVSVSTLGMAQTIDSTKANPPRKLGVVATAHLDTQWRWTIKNTIGEYISATFNQNEALFKKYPNYVFSFEGAFRYMLLKEYYPDKYERLKKYVADGRWRVCGSWVDAVDVNIPSFESIVRQTLYGNGYFKQEFGKTSRDIFLPDCFGFGYALPSIAHHCGLRSFSTQKLSWGSAIERPFDIGLWKGVDGSTVIAGINPGSYGSEFRGDLSRDTAWLRKIDKQAEKSGVPIGYAYFGTGDQGGSPDSLSVDWLERSMKSDGPISVKSIGADDLVDLVGKDSSKLPVYDGELVLTRHGVGCYTSEAAMKRWNRKNELLADATERACVIASLYAGATYPGEELKQTWIRFLWHQFHDDLTGTSIPEAYAYSWNDELLCQNRFASMLTDAVSNIAPMLDTRTKGMPLIVYNPVSVARQDVMTIEIPDSVEQMQVVGPDGKEVPSHLLDDAKGSGQKQHMTFLASAPSVGYAVYDLRVSEPSKLKGSELTITDRSLENARYAMKFNDAGDVSSIYDKVVARELLSAPIQYQFLFDKPKQWPAWELQYEDVIAKPADRFVSAPEIKMIDQRPVRVGLEINRKTEKSKFHLIVWLAAGEAGNKVVFENSVDWYERETLLKAAFQFSTPNDSVTYDIGLGTIKRGLNTDKKYEVPGQQWADLTAADGSYGVAVLNDCKYGWDHPDQKTLRLSLIHTPGVYENWSWVGDQSSQDNGHHIFTFAVEGHKGDWRDGNVVVEAARLNQRLLGFHTASKQKGKLGKNFSLVEVRSSSKTLPVVITSIMMSWQLDSIYVDGLYKWIKEAKTNRKLRHNKPALSIPFVVRVRETTGHHGDAKLRFTKSVRSASEINGQEDSLAQTVMVNGDLASSLDPYQPRAFVVHLDKTLPFDGNRIEFLDPDRNQCKTLTLEYTQDGMSTNWSARDGDLDGHGNTLAGETMTDEIWCMDIPFRFGSRGVGQKNVLTCGGQKIRTTVQNFAGGRLYLLAMATNGGVEDDITLPGGVKVKVRVPDWLEPVGQWNNRMVGGKMVEDPEQIAPEFINSIPVAWFSTHYHNAKGENVTYKYTYAYVIELPAVDSITLPNNPNLKILAATVAQRTPRVTPAQPLYDVATAAIARISVDKSAFIDSSVVTLSSPNVGAVIRYSLDGTEPTSQSTKYERPFAVSTSGTIKARAFVPGVEGDYVASATVYKLLPHPAVTVDKTVPGLLCSYYEGDWKKLPNFDSLKVVKDTVVDSVGIPKFAKDSLFGLVFRGYIRIPREGLYDFSLSSDDGSALWIGDSLVVNNDGLHGSGEVPGQIALKAGLHPITVHMFQQKGDRALDMYIAGPEVQHLIVPGSMLCRDQPMKGKGKKK